MQRKNYEYALIRVVPQVEREEFLNVGIILYCKSCHFLDTEIALDAKRLLSLNPSANTEEITAHLEAFIKVTRGDSEAGPIALLDMASRFRWLTATRSTIIQCSSVHVGLCENPRDALNRLYQELVLI